MKTFSTYCLSLCITFFPVLLHSWTTPINISNTPDGRSGYPAIAVNKYNRIYVVWSDDCLTGWFGNNIFACYSDDSVTWSDYILVSGDSNNMLTHSDAACDTFGNPHVLWEDWRGSADIYYSKWETDSWTPEVNLSNSPTRISQCPNIAVDSRNTIHVIWQEGASPGYAEIFYRYYDRAFWSDTINISHNPEPSGNPAIAIDLEDNIHVVWGDSNEDGGGIFYSKFDGISWSEPSRIPNTEQSCDASIVTDYFGYPHVAWTEVLAPQDEEIYYSYYNDTSWRDPINISHSTMTSVGGQDIAVATINHIYLVWGEGRAGSSQRDIYFSCIIGDVISRKVNISNTPDNVSSYTDITVDLNNNTHVVWSEGFSLDEIYYTCYYQTSVDEQNMDMFYTTRLLQNQPNPFREETVISYRLSVIGEYHSPISLQIYDITGQIVHTFNLCNPCKSVESVIWDGRDNTGKIAPCGVYFLKFNAGEYTATRKMLKVR